MNQRPWRQAVIEFTNRRVAEQVAVEHLRPALVAAQSDSRLATWWFIRKTPYWRLRYQPTSHEAASEIAKALDDLTSQGQIVGWTTSIYEPEVHAFGGTSGMDVAHELFHRDSHHVLDYLHQTARLGGRAATHCPLGRRELGILLISVLLRTAGQDWYEQGDVWAKVSDLRPVEPTTPLTASDREHHTPAVRRLMTVDVSPTSRIVNAGPLAALADWSAAFEHAGQQLAQLAHQGALRRGLRAVLAHHIIFHWNRLGLPTADQIILSTLAKEVVMGTNDKATAAVVASAPQPAADTANVGDVKPDGTEVSARPNAAAGPDPATGPNRQTADHTEMTPDALRQALVDKLRAQGTVRTKLVEAALRRVPRHLFVPEVSPETAYFDDAVYTKQDGAGTSISAASQPTIVAMMLEQLQVEPGHRVLELGAGTGYNAALLGNLAGDHGLVVTIDVDQDIVDRAEAGLTSAGIKNVRAILGDGAVGHPADGPYDRIIATVGAWGVPAPWLEQLAPAGRLVVPLRIRGSVSRSMVFERDVSLTEDGDARHWRCIAHELSTFMPLRGIADDARRMVPLTLDGSVTLQTHQEQVVDTEALLGVLDQPLSIERWTGATFRGAESMEWMELWLTCSMDNALCRMPVERSAVDEGLVKPQFGWGSVAVTENADLAYLTIRLAAPAADGSKQYEVGVIGHGPTSNHLANKVADSISTWNHNHRSQSVQIELQQHPPQHLTPGTATNTAPGRFTVDTPTHRLTLAWQ